MWTDTEITTENISSTVSSEMRRDAIVAVVICNNLYAALYLVQIQGYPFCNKRGAGIDP